jgi:phosphorylcholine metabolism protein LicD
VADSREGRQLELIHEFASLAEEAGIEYRLRGGWALDSLLGRVTRPHEDINMFIWAADAQRLLAKLKERGYEEIGARRPSSSGTSSRTARRCV